MTTVQGKNFIGYALSSEGERHFKAYAPATDSYLPETFQCATAEEVNKTMELAERAFDSYSQVPAAARAAFLIAITEEILALGDQLLERASQETGLPIARLQGERARTINQLTQFAELLREGSWIEASIDTALPDRSPVPKPDIRKMLVPIGPVIVFGSQLSIRLFSGRCGFRACFGRWQSGDRQSPPRSPGRERPHGAGDRTRGRAHRYA